MDAPRRQKGAATPRRQRCPASLSTTARNPTVLKLKSAWAATATGARAALPQNCPRGENRASQQGCKQNLSNNLVTSGKQGNYYLLNRFTAPAGSTRSSRYRSKRRTQTALLAGRLSHGGLFRRSHGTAVQPQSPPDIPVVQAPGLLLPAAVSANLPPDGSAAIPPGPHRSE
jgi:hypothetical protein